ncbi:unnamed protein product [Effrenium voratum]|uniref:Glycosyl transferase family 25 domain-containing protein n=1 Tax=Effrenium voratum TaxID=2562239 RepID=A0AA36HXJ7_9DINO|nr:unnamed protein product [Effrenium voratum]
MADWASLIAEEVQQFDGEGHAEGAGDAQAKPLDEPRGETPQAPAKTSAASPVVGSVQAPRTGRTNLQAPKNPFLGIRHFPAGGYEFRPQHGTKFPKIERLEGENDLQAAYRAAAALRQSGLGAFDNSSVVAAQEALDAWGQGILALHRLRNLRAHAESDVGPSEDAVNELDLVLRLNVAQALLQLRCFEEANLHCEAALEIDPGNPKALWRKAKAVWALRCPGEARSVLEEFLAQEPKNPAAVAMLREIEVEELKKKAKRVGPAFKPKTQLLGHVYCSKVRKTQKVRRQRRRGSTPSSPEAAGGSGYPSPAAHRGIKRDFDGKPCGEHDFPVTREPKPIVADPKSSTDLRDVKAVVINLDRRPDRLAECGKRLDVHSMEYERMRASDGRLDSIGADEVTHRWHTGRNVVYQKIRSRRKGWDDLHTYVVRELDMSAGERGCAMSHIRAWRYCESAERPMLVMEDDAVPTKEFREVLSQALTSLPRDADVLYLGYSQAAEWRRHVSKNVAEAEYVWTTVAYLVWPEGARKLLSKLPVNQPVDNFMATLCADGDIKAYVTLPKIVHQADGWNVKSDVGHSDEAPAPGVATSDVFHTDDKYWGDGPANPHFACTFSFGSDIVKSDDRYWE